MFTETKPLTFVSGGNVDNIMCAARRQNMWRPTVCALVQLGNRFVFLWARKSTHSRRIKIKKDIVKGGVEKWQSAATALQQELFEEVRLSWRDVRYARFIGHSLVPFDKNNQGRDGYEKGKLYLIYHVVLKNGACLAPGKDHRTERLVLRDHHAAFLTKAHKSNLKQPRKYRILSDPKVAVHLKASRRR